MIDTTKANEIEGQLVELAGCSVMELRDFLRGNIRAGGDRRTGYRFVRGTHSGSFVRDPEGTDILPAGVEAPR